MIKNLLVCVGCMLMCLFTSCGDDEPKVTETTGGKYETTICGVAIRITPIFLKSGEEISISVNSENGESTTIFVSSESLGIHETFTTPFTWKKTLYAEGRHELEFSMGTTNVSFLTSTTIEVRE